MIIATKKGNLFETEDYYIAHGCNCHGVMGAGVAYVVRRDFPEAFKQYAALCDRTPALNLLGAIQIVDTENKGIVNAFTQYDTVGDKPVSYDAIHECFSRLNQELRLEHSRGKLSIPKIGAGLGGGNWKVIEQIINDVTPDIDITVWEL